MTALLLLGLTLVAGCVQTVPASPSAGGGSSGGGARVSIAEVSGRIEAVSEAECRARLPRGNCDFEILVETDPAAGINAFQTVDRSGRPVIIVTQGLIREVLNADELAFVIGHEAAHHIRQHIPQQVNAARRGALVFGILAQMGGGDEAAVREAAQLGATVGARRFSQDHELQADQLGTIIAMRAGYDPILGAAFFQRLPDPGNRILGTHPPNAEREAIVRRTAAGL
ncbi:M48 family metalloprotease [Rhodobacterales bacterium HKCCE2091]|nr:M48 family metalloprotease [Rhodobacterales bacterium HKCCE2091]